jgi:hypothetical protein
MEVRYKGDWGTGTCQTMGNRSAPSSGGGALHPAVPDDGGEADGGEADGGEADGGEADGGGGDVHTDAPCTLEEMADPNWNWGAEDLFSKEEAYELWAVYISGVPLKGGCMLCDDTEAITFVIVALRHVRQYISANAKRIPKEFAYVTSFKSVLEYGYAWIAYMPTRDPTSVMWYTPNGSSGGKFIDTSIRAPPTQAQSLEFQSKVLEAYENHICEFIGHVHPNEFSMRVWLNYIVQGGDIGSWRAAEEERTKVTPAALVLEDYGHWQSYFLEY